MTRSWLFALFSVGAILGLTTLQSSVALPGVKAPQTIILAPKSQGDQPIDNSDLRDWLNEAVKPKKNRG